MKLKVVSQPSTHLRHCLTTNQKNGNELGSILPSFKCQKESTTKPFLILFVINYCWFFFFFLRINIIICSHPFPRRLLKSWKNPLISNTHTFHSTDAPSGLSSTGFLLKSCSYSYFKPLNKRVWLKAVIRPHSAEINI